MAVTLGAGGIGVTNALIDSGERAVYRPIEACRMVDTRPEYEPNNVTEPIGPNRVITFDLDDALGDCESLPDATGLALNVTPVDPTAATYLSFLPGVLTPPATGVYDRSSNLNPTPGEPPVPNAVEVDLDDEHRFSVYNAYGSVDVVIDIVGYYEDHHHDDRYYTETETDEMLANLGAAKADAADVYTRADIDTVLSTKADGSDVYTKPELDGRTRRQIISFPAEGLNLSGSTVIEADPDNTYGLVWQHSASGSAAITIARPPDWAGGDVTLHIQFNRVSSVDGNVQFFARADSFDIGDEVDDVAGIVSTIQGEADMGVVRLRREVTIDLPADRLGKSWWIIPIQRVLLPVDAYPHAVHVAAVTLEYDATF